jgi:hypothetical protein
MIGKHINISNRPIPTQWFYKHELLFLGILCFTGITSSVITVPLVDDYKYNFGRNVIGLFIPPFLALVYLTAYSFYFRLNKLFLIKALILYLILIIPFTPIFLQVFQPTPHDDFSRYYLYAQNMVDNHTLWGGDKLFFPDEGNYYVTQPGYRYFIAFELLLFRKLYRFVSFINIGCLIVGFYYLLKLIQEVVYQKWLQRSLLFLVLLFTPYAVKNLLMGLPEWLTVLLLVTAVYLFLIRKKYFSAMVILGLVPFFRQNLLFTVLLLALVLLYYVPQKFKLLLCFLIPLFLPLYHNLYFAHEWRFFVRIFELPFLDSSPAKTGLSKLDFSIVVNNLIHYLGLDIINGKVHIIPIAILFLPFSLVLYIVLLNKLVLLNWRLVFITITMSAIVPAIFLGTAYFPRFEFVNIAVALITFLILYDRISVNIVRGTANQQM